jgi:16S rRNA (cytosine967-C5)-methyltransferase
MAVAAARVVAYAVIRRVFEDGAYADRVFNAEASGLDGRDRALAMALAYGAVQRRLTLDHLAELLTERPLAKLDPSVLAALRLGLQQIVFLDGIAEHAAVNDSVELVKASGTPGGAGLVNAVLRRAIRDGRQLIDALTDATPEAAALKYSVPEWLTRLWFDELGGDSARSLLGSVNAPAESAVRINTLKGAPAEIAARISAAWHPAAELPEGVVIDASFDAWGSELFATGAIMPQSRASMLVARMLDPRPGERVLDICAAPGAKTTHLAALMEARGTLSAVEVNSKRADGLVRTATRMAADFVEVIVGDARTVALDAPGYDRVLVDPPCSGLGTLQSRPDIRWHTSLERLRDVTSKQAGLLAAGAAATRPGGTLVYSVCTISEAESGGILEPFIAGDPGWSIEQTRILRPDIDATDGFFVARLRRDD